ncbi:MAG: hypothetical protein ACXWRE_13460 [Pseudobdellovibrionaceae bacterium]
MKEVMETIRRYLQYWDPIGVIPDLIKVGLPPNEYDSYAGPIYTMLTEGKSAEEIQNHLNLIVTERMDMKTNDEKNRVVAEGLHMYFHEHSGYRK